MLSSLSGVSDLFPLDPQPLQRITCLLQVVAITGHPVKSRHPPGKQIAVNIETNIDLGAADVHEGMIYNGPL